MQIETADLQDVEQSAELARQAATVLREGGLVVFPTETVYGVGACAASPQAFEALRRLKGEGASSSFAVHLPGAAAVGRYVDLSAPPLRRLVEKVFPGPVTLLVEVEPQVIETKLRAMGLDASAGDRLYHDGSIALRCPDHGLARQVLELVEAPVVAGAACREGQAPPHDAAEAAERVGADVDLVLDGGRCRYAKPSTMVRVSGRGTARTIRVEREGVYDERFIRKLTRWHVLFVCSGNTCRSPMAAGLMRRLLAEQRGIAPDELESAGVSVSSAGVFAAPGQPATEHAVTALAKQGIDLSAHRSTPLTPALVREADVIYCMTESHRRAVLEMAPEAADKTFRLDPNGDIEDPYGTEGTSYQRTAEVIRRHLVQRLKEQQP